MIEFSNTAKLDQVMPTYSPVSVGGGFYYSAFSCIRGTESFYEYLGENSLSLLSRTELLFNLNPRRGSGP